MCNLLILLALVISKGFVQVSIFLQSSSKKNPKVFSLVAVNYTERENQAASVTRNF